MVCSIMQYRRLVRPKVPSTRHGGRFLSLNRGGIGITQRTSPWQYDSLQSKGYDSCSQIVELIFQPYGIFLGFSALYSTQGVLSSCYLFGATSRMNVELQSFLNVSGTDWNVMYRFARQYKSLFKYLAENVFSYVYWINLKFW